MEALINILQSSRGNATRKDRLVHFEAPDLQRPEDAMQAIGRIVNGVAYGNLSVPEAAGIVGAFVKAVEATDLQARIERLEELLKAKQ